MTQKYYAQCLLPVYITAINKACLEDPKGWILQEDNDPSYSSKGRTNRKTKVNIPSLCIVLKYANWVDTLNHPSNSPDLNPIEACWSILKQRVCKRTWDSLDQLKEIL